MLPAPLKKNRWYYYPRKKWDTILREKHFKICLEKAIKQMAEGKD